MIERVVIEKSITSMSANGDRGTRLLQPHLMSVGDNNAALASGLTLGESGIEGFA